MGHSQHVKEIWKRFLAVVLCFGTQTYLHAKEHESTKKTRRNESESKTCLAVSLQRRKMCTTCAANVYLIQPLQDTRIGKLVTSLFCLFGDFYQRQSVEDDPSHLLIYCKFFVRILLCCFFLLPKVKALLAHFTSTFHVSEFNLSVHGWLVRACLENSLFIDRVQTTDERIEQQFLINYASTNSIFSKRLSTSHQTEDGDEEESDVWYLTRVHPTLHLNGLPQNDTFTKLQFQQQQCIKQKKVPKNPNDFI